MHGHPGRVVSAIFEPGQSRHQHVGDRTGTDVSNDSTHCLELLAHGAPGESAHDRIVRTRATTPVHRTGSTSDGPLFPESPPGFAPIRHDGGSAGKASAEEFDHLPPRHLQHADRALSHLTSWPIDPSSYASFPRVSATTVAKRSAYSWAASTEGASTITLMSGSVPDGRNNTRPSSPNSSSTSRTSSQTRSAASRSAPRPTRTFSSTW